MYRPPAIGMHAMVSSGNALASMAGLRVMMEGGNAFDATVAVAAGLQATQPYVCGLGGDAFALMYEAASGKVHGYNGSGRAPAAMTIDAVRGLGHERMPRLGGLTVTVPGALDAWWQIHKRFGSRPWGELLQPAIEFARDGHPIGRSGAGSLERGKTTYARFRSWQETFAPGGRTPRADEVWRQPELAGSLEAVAAGGPDALYRGELAERIVAAVREEGGLLALDDLASHEGEWAEPVTTTYRGYEVYETAPNSQGLTALIALNLLEEVDLAASGPGTSRSLRYMIDACRLAYADRDRYLCDPAFSDIPLAELLSKARVRGSLGGARDAPPVTATSAGDTTSFCVVDQAGNAVSFIQSNYGGFGSGLAAGGFGLQNRGAYFSLDPAHVNRLEPGKRTLHTIMAALVCREGAPCLLFGAVGGDTQPQTHVQVLTNVLDHAMNIQKAIEAPRFVLGEQEGGEGLERLRLETRFDEAVFDELSAAGYAPERAPSLEGRPGFSAGFGLGHGIAIDQSTGARFGGADPRWDAYAAGY
jgi:gamma-glutamyltranspeptidase/glutathione hydrolase